MLQLSLHTNYNYTSSIMPGGVCMKGNIYTAQKCPSCGEKMIHEERQNNCICIKCKIPASGGYFVRFGRDICKRFRNDYLAAAQFLNGLRFKTAEGTFDQRDYQKDFPLGFIKQAEKWLNVKKASVKPSSHRNLSNYMKKAMNIWGDTNIKVINYGMIEDFLYNPTVVKNDKTRANMKSCLHDFFNWVSKRERIPVPSFPDCKFDLGTRPITDWNTQTSIIDEVHKISNEINPKIWFGIELLSSYVELRPGDLLRITEADYNEKHSVITISNPTKSKNKFKSIRLNPEHAELFISLKNKYTGMPNMPFFRHTSGINRIQPNTPFGEKYFYKWWVKACDNLGIKNLDLYGGTRHTTTTELARLVGTDGARKATGHETNKAFDRYCQHQDDSAFEMSQIIIQKKRGKKGNVHNFKSK